MRMGKTLKSLFWDVDVKQLDEKKQADFLIVRIAEKGGIKEVNWLKKKYNKSRIKRVVKNSRNVSAKTKNYWSVI
jgi:hypothetical protein